MLPLFLHVLFMGGISLALCCRLMSSRREAAWGYSRLTSWQRSLVCGPQRSQKVYELTEIVWNILHVVEHASFWRTLSCAHLVLVFVINWEGEELLRLRALHTTSSFIDQFIANRGFGDSRKREWCSRIKFHNLDIYSSNLEAIYG